jgi:quercetin dioxygenase-like cupin family protein
VLKGEAEFELNGEVTRAAAGSFVLVPGGAAHVFGAAPAAPTRLLVLHAPGWTATSGNSSGAMVGHRSADP